MKKNKNKIIIMVLILMMSPTVFSQFSEIKVIINEHPIENLNPDLCSNHSLSHKTNFHNSEDKLKQTNENYPIYLDTGLDIITYVNTTTEFEASACSPSSNITEYYWDFNNDGEFELTTLEQECYESSKVNYTYNDTGNYTVIVKAWDTWDNNSTSIDFINVWVKSGTGTQEYVNITVNETQIPLPAQPLPADGDIEKYALLINGDYEERFWEDVEFIYEMLINEYEYTPENISLLNYNGSNFTGENPDDMIDDQATSTNIHKALNDFTEKVDGDDILSIWITNHGCGLYGPNTTHYGFFCSHLYDHLTLNEEGDEQDWLESDFKLRYFFISGWYRKRLGMDEWGCWRTGDDSDDYYVRYKIVSHFTDIYFKKLNETLSDSDKFIERFSNNLKGDFNQNGKLDLNLNETEDYDNDGNPPYNSTTGVFDEDDWDEIWNYQDDILTINNGVPTEGGYKKYVVWDENLDNHIDIDINTTFFDDGNLVIDGTDIDNDGLIDGLDINCDGDKTDWVSIDEIIFAYESSFSDDELASWLENIKAERIITVLMPCFSGGFIWDLRGPKSITCSAETGDDVSQGNLFIRGVAAALYGEDIDGDPVNADKNGDGNISIVEAFDYSCENNYYYSWGADDPQYEDDGDGISHGYPIPNGTDGYLGENTFMFTYINPPEPLEADIGGPYYGLVNETIYINGSANNGYPPYYYLLDVIGPPCSMQTNVHYLNWSCDTPGNYTVKFQVFDNENNIENDTSWIILRDYNNQPYTPVKPSGPSICMKNINYNYSTNATDPDGDPMYFMWDWGDNTTSEWLGPVNSEQTHVASHNWSQWGFYNIKVKAKDVFGNETDWSEEKLVNIYNSPPYTPSKPSGPTICKKNINYDYSTNTTDPNGDPIYFMWDWGDNTTSEWLGPVNSEQTHVASHNWSQWGFYNIKVKAKDVDGNETDWSEEKLVYVRLFSGFGISPSSYSQSSQTIYFNDNSKSYYQIVNWTWDFGDGNFSFAQNTSHTYANDGIYNVTLAITDNMSASNASSQQICIDSVQPEISSVTSTPTSLAGINSDIDINVDAYDEFSGVDTVKINVTYPDDSYHIFTMNNNTNSSIYDLVFNDSWLVGQFNYTVLVFDKSNNINSSSGHNFNILMQGTMSVCTIKDEYGPNEMINLTDPPGEPPLIGYELLDNGDVLHIWNKHNSYYLDTDSGIQLTNHYDEYWSHNVLMLGYYNNDQWNLVYRTDELSGFNKNINSDNETYVNATIWKDLSYGGYDFRLAIRYHLGMDDADLTVIPYIKNLDEDEIPYQLGFGWEIKDIRIADVENDNYLQIYNGTGWEHILLSQTLDKSYTDMDHNTTIRLICTNPPTYHLSRELYLSWNENLTYKVTCKSRTGQNNTPVTLFIKIGTLDVDQEKYTMMHWLDSDDWLGITGNNRDSECGYDHISVTFEKALNGTSFWAHDQWETHWGIVDLGQSYTVKKVRGRSDFFDDPIDVNIYVSENKTNWGTAVVTGISTWQDTSSWVEVDTVDKDGRYIKIEINDTESMFQALSFGNDMVPFKIFDVYGGINQLPVISNPFPSNGSTGVLISPMLKIVVSDLENDIMNITWLSNSSGSWIPFGTNYSVANGLYAQPMVNAGINGQWWYWNVSVNDGENTNVSDVFKFYTGYQSKIKNTGSTNISGYLLIQVQYYNTTSSTWVVANDTVNETSPRTINCSEQFGLDTVFNGLVNTSSLSDFGSGSYRIYAAFRGPDGDVLVCNDNSELEATYAFAVTFD